MTGPRRHLSVDLELDCDSLSGTVSGDGRGAERFHDWLGLMSAVEARRPEADVRRSERDELGSDEPRDTSEEDER